MRKLLALILLVFIAAPLIAITLGLLSVDSWILDREFYVKALSDERLYEVLLADNLPAEINRQALTEVDSLPAGALSAALREVVTPGYMRQQAVTNVNALFDYFEGRAPAPTLTLDLQPIKAQLAGEAGTRFAQTLAASLPACAAGEDPIAPGGSVMRCRPVETSIEEAAAQIEAGLPRLLETVSSRLEFGHAEFDSVDWLFGVTLRGQLNRALTGLVLASLLVWLVAGLIAGNTLRERMLWLGWGLLLPAVPGALTGLALMGAAASAAIQVNVARSAAASAAMQQAIIGVVTPAINITGSTLFGLGAVLSFVGIIFIIIGSRMERAPYRDAPTVLIKAKRDEL